MNAVKLVSPDAAASGFVRLARWETVGVASADARKAALAFMHGTLGGWNHTDLVAWLLGPYWKATRHTSEGGWGAIGDITSPRDEAEVAATLFHAREEIFEKLQRVAEDFSMPVFVDELVDYALVSNAIDDGRRTGFVPRRLAGMTLTERVTSLFAADFLARSEDYVGLWTCDDCGGVGIGALGEHIPGCDAVRIQSAIRICTR